MTILNERIYCFDVDDTLIRWDLNSEQPIKAFDPILKDIIDIVPNLNIVRLLKEKKARGCYIIVWSLGGASYAEAVVKALHLDSYVDLIMTKPAGIIDDKDPVEWLPRRIYIDPNANYKRRYE